MAARTIAFARTHAKKELATWRGHRAAQEPGEYNTPSAAAAFASHVSNVASRAFSPSANARYVASYTVKRCFRASIISVESDVSGAIVMRNSRIVVWKIAKASTRRPLRSSTINVCAISQRHSAGTIALPATDAESAD